MLLATRGFGNGVLTGSISGVVSRGYIVAIRFTTIFLAGMVTPLIEVVGDVDTNKSYNGVVAGNISTSGLLASPTATAYLSVDIDHIGIVDSSLVFNAIASPSISTYGVVDTDGLFNASVDNDITITTGTVAVDGVISGSTTLNIDSSED
jgi:hypothetical protein